MGLLVREFNQMKGLEKDISGGEAKSQGESTESLELLVIPPCWRGLISLEYNCRVCEGDQQAWRGKQGPDHRVLLEL